MSNILDQHFLGKWWVKPTIDWSNIGADVVSRPTENTALNEISLQVKYLQNLKSWSLEYTDIEKEVMRLEYIVSREDFNINYIKLFSKVYRVDSNIRRISKITGYSEQFVIRVLNNITRKSYLMYILNIPDNFSICYTEDDISRILNIYTNRLNNKKKSKSK